MSRLDYAYRGALTMTCTVTPYAPGATDADGQPGDPFAASTPVVGVRCRLLALSEQDVAHTDLVAFSYHLEVLPDAPLALRDRVGAIREANGALYDDGPFAVADQFIRRGRGPVIKTLRLVRVGGPG